MHAAAARKAEEEAELRKRRLLERQRAEEEDAVNSDPRVKFWIELVEENATPPDAIIRAHPTAQRALVKSLELNRSLLTLDLCRSSLGDDVGTQLAMVRLLLAPHVAAHNSLLTLAVACCGVSFLSQVLTSNTSLLKVTLDDNNLGPATAAALGEALSSNATLRSLSLEENPLTHDKDYDGIASLARMLQSNATLTFLNLWKTGVGDQGGQALAAALPTNNTLVCLQLSPADGVKFADLEAITACLEENMRIYEVEQEVLRQDQAAERAAQAEAKRQRDEEQAKKEEEEWLEEQAKLRAKNRAEAAIMAKKAEEDARIAREEAERKRREDKARKEAEEKAKKKKKGKKGKKKKKK